MRSDPIYRQILTNLAALAMIVFATKSILAQNMNGQVINMESQAACNNWAVGRCASFCSNYNGCDYTTSSWDGESCYYSGVCNGT